MTNYHLPKHLFFILLAVIIGVWGCCSVEDTPSNNNEAKETSANYTVMHYQQNANDDKYTAVKNDTETLTGTVGSETTATAKSYAGFTAQKFEQEKIAANGSTTVKIYYDRKMITLTLNCDNGTAAKTITGKFGADINVTDPTKLGYTFATWNPELPATFPAEDAQYTANWVKEGDYIITYKNTENAINDNPAGYNVETETITLKTATKAGYIFDDWYKEDSFATKVTEITKGSTGDVTLYAKWIITADTVAAAIGALSGEGPHDIAVVGEITGETISAISAALNKNITAKVNLDLSQTTGLTSIDRNAFADCSSLTSVTIPNSVTSIGNYAFVDCSSLTSVTIPDSVTSIGSSAFSICSSLTSVTIPDSVTSIGEYAFFYCNNLTSVTIGNGVIYIDSHTFDGCSNLTSVTIPDGVTSIGNYAFSNCSSLTSVTIPDSVTSIGSSAFSNCSSLTSVTIPDSVTSIGSSAFYGCSNLTSVTIPNSVTFIGNSAFSRCSSLTNVVIPDSVTSISAYAFSGCSSLTSVTIPDSVTSISISAFSDCSSLTSVTIPDSVTSISAYAFQDCHSLTSVTIPDSVTSIGNSAFSNCSSLTTVNFKGSEEQWKAISIDDHNDLLTASTTTINYNYTGE